MSDGILVGSWKEIFLPPSPQNFMTGIASGAVSGAVSGIAFAVVYDMGEVVVRMYRGRQARNRAVGSQVVPRDIAGSAGNESSVDFVPTQVGLAVLLLPPLGRYHPIPKAKHPERERKRTELSSTPVKATFVKRLNDVLSCVPRPQPPLKSNSLGWLTDKMCSISLTGELNLGPLAPSTHTIQSYLNSFVWSDDLSEERLRGLWEGQEELVDVINAMCGGETSYVHTNFSDEPFRRAALMFREKRYHGIIELLSEAIERGCSVFRPHALLMRGTFHILWRDTTKALQDLDAVSNTGGVSRMLVLNALIKKANIYAGVPELTKVTECFDRCLKLDEACPDVLIHKAKFLLESSDDAESMKVAVESLEEATTMAPESAYALYSLAEVYHRLGGLMQSEQMLNKAVNIFEKAAVAFPEYGDGLVLRAKCLKDMSQNCKTWLVLTRAAELEPDNPSVYLSLGMLALSSSQPDEAKAHLLKAIEVDSSCVKAYDTLATLELQERNSLGALDLYHTAARFARSQIELSRVLVCKEMISAQHHMSLEESISFNDIMSCVL